MEAAKNYAVFGDPVAHSLSPALFEWLFVELGLSARYQAVRVRAVELPSAIERVRSGKLDGASITLPHKEAACGLVDELDGRAKQIGSSNCLLRSAVGRVRGCNTDADGFLWALAHHGVSLAGAHVLVLGAGGAGRAAAFAAAGSGARSLAVANRTIDRATRLCDDLVAAGCVPSPPTVIAHAGPSPCMVQALPLTSAALSPVLEDAQVVANTTSVGLMAAASNPLPAGCEVSSRHTVLDMVYRPLQTALLGRAMHQGGRAIDGLWMLIYQAFEQLRLWTGVAVETELAQRGHDMLRKRIN